jgi:phosphate transport system substrate-binding protein
MKRYYALLAFLGLIISIVSTPTSATDITGAGATFPYPLYAKWAEFYKQQTGIGMNYQSIGSGGGIKQIEAKTVDFGATDKPLKPEELQAKGLVQFPTVMGGVVPVINLPGIQPGQIRLSGAVLADIFLGKIKKWNDINITKLNPGLSLPAQNITVVHRADGSGTTFIFTNYLSKVSAQWQQQIGEEASVKWPTGIGGKGNEGVAQYVQRVKGGIGYVEYAYAKQNKMTHTQLQNKAKHFVHPTAHSFSAAATHANWQQAPGFYKILTDEPGKDSWPITGATFILMHKKQDKPEQGRAVLNFFDWAYTQGNTQALALDYVPMPAKVIALIKKAWQINITDGKNALYQ